MNHLSRWLKKYFIPHEHNEFKPHFLRRESALLILLVVIIIELSFLVQVFIVFDKTSFLASVLPGVLTSLTNKERAENNVAPVVENDLLVKAAQLKADDMAARGYFAHTSPDGKTPWYWLEQVGYNYSSAGENLAMNFFESKDVAKAWMESPTHRENIMKNNYKEVGIAVASGVYKGNNTVFVAQFFGTPMAVAASSTPNPPQTQVKPATTPNPALAKPPTTTNGGTPTKAVEPPATIPKVTPPATAPTPAPRAVAVVVPTPTAIQVLGEETNPAIATTENLITFSEIKAFVQKVLASPREYVTYVYAGILILIIMAMLLAIFIRAEMTHPLIVTRGAMLVVTILFLLFVNTKLVHFEISVPTEGISASVIASH